LAEPSGSVPLLRDPDFRRYVAARGLSLLGNITTGGTAGRQAVLEERETQRESAEALLEEVVGEAGVAYAERRALVGVPAERIADLADEEDAELIVVGSRGRGAFKAAFLGSVSNSLVGVARRPVLIVPPGAAAAS
jgi:nucleotide-binding universal stress UspA family protein